MLFHGSCDIQGSFVFSKLSEVARACCGLWYTNKSDKLTRTTGQLHKAISRSLAFWPLTNVFVRPSRCKRDVSQQSWSFAIFEVEAKQWWLRKEWHVCSYKASFLFLHLNIAVGLETMLANYTQKIWHLSSDGKKKLRVFMFLPSTATFPYLRLSFDLIWTFSAMVDAATSIFMGFIIMMVMLMSIFWSPMVLFLLIYSGVFYFIFKYCWLF